MDIDSDNQFLEKPNSGADFWRYEIGVNVIPADTKNKRPKVDWKEYQTVPIREEQHVLWKGKNEFRDGMAIIPGRVLHNRSKENLYLICVDLDNQRAIAELCTWKGSRSSLEELSKHIIVEQHRDDLSRAHFIFYATHPFKKKSLDISRETPNRNEIPAIEVKGNGEHGILFVSPSMHKRGFRYEILGTRDPEIVDGLELHIDNICKKYKMVYLENSIKCKPVVSISQLFHPETKIYEGHNRHEAILRVMESLLRRNRAILGWDQIKQIVQQWNSEHCVPPLNNEQFERQWTDAVNFISSCDIRDDLTWNKVKVDSSDESLRHFEKTELNMSQGQSISESLVETVQKKVRLLFNDQYGTPFALLNTSDHIETIPIEGNRFRRFLAKTIYDDYHKVVSSDTISNATQVLQAKTVFEGPTIPIHLRVAWSPDRKSIIYDLTNRSWQYVNITRNGWDIIDETPSLFMRYNQVTQVDPLKNYEKDTFDKFLALTNVRDGESIILLKVYIISLFVPDLSHAMLVLHGEKGSTKSTLQSLIKMLVDPAKPILLTIHNDRSEFIQQLAHNYVAYYDNIKHVPDWLSDEACKAVTGIGHTRRKLYTNDEDMVYEYKRCLGFNGINISLSEPDALDRSIMIELQRVMGNTRKLESEIYAEFEKLRPGLLGYIFDIIVESLKLIDSIKLAELPRMADFALWGEAISQSMGYRKLEFIRIYYKNIGWQNIEAVEASPLAQTIVKLSDEEPDWYGSTTELLEKIHEIAVTLKINTDSKYFPKAANSLSRGIKKIRSNLLEGLGIDICVTRLTTDNLEYKKNTSMTRIRKLSPPPPLD